MPSPIPLMLPVQETIRRLTAAPLRPLRTIDLMAPQSKLMVAAGPQSTWRTVAEEAASLKWGVTQVVGSHIGYPEWEKCGKYAGTAGGLW